MSGARDASTGLIEFRLKFLLEELLELSDACGYELTDSVTGFRFEPKVITHPIEHAKLFDGLLDLAYVTLGFAHVMGYPWQSGWDEVQRANITKERCGIDHVFNSEGVLCRERVSPDNLPCGRPRVAHSLRGSKWDVIKPEGWMPPDIAGILRAYGWKL